MNGYDSNVHATMLDTPTKPSEGLSLRPIQLDDIEFLSAVYAASRADEMALIAEWSDAQKANFLKSQFKAQHAHYQSHFPKANYDIIVKSGKPVGRLYVDRSETEIRLMDIALLPKFRNQGIGALLVRNVLDEATKAGQWVSLHVEDNNPAKRLYQRLGFFDVPAEVAFYTLMHWKPSRFDDGGHSPEQE